MPPALRDEVVERLAMMGPTPVEVIERVVQVLSQKAGPQPARVLSQTGGVRSAAALLNSLEKNLSQSVLRDLEKRNPELGREIRQKMFTFEDLILLGPSALQKIMREIDLRDLALSLKTAGAQLKTSSFPPSPNAPPRRGRGNSHARPAPEAGHRGRPRAASSRPCANWKTPAKWT
jgi:flagellar motor switch protein FliG